MDGDPDFDTNSDIYIQEPESVNVCGGYEVQNMREEEEGHKDCLVAGADREHHGNDTHLLKICPRDEGVSISDDFLPSILSETMENNDNASGAYSITSQEPQSHQDDVLNMDLTESMPAETSLQLTGQSLQMTGVPALLMVPSQTSSTPVRLETSGHPKRKIAVVLNQCLCGEMANRASDGILECKQMGCEMRWVSVLTYLLH